VGLKVSEGESSTSKLDLIYTYLLFKGGFLLSKCIDEDFVGLKYNHKYFLAL